MSKARGFCQGPSTNEISRQDKNDREKPFKCDKCSSCFGTKNSLKSHKTYVHSDVRPFTCDFCDYSAKTRPCLKQHELTHLPNSKRFPCQWCPFKTRTKTHLADHVRTHTGERPFKCPHCDFSCSTSSYIHEHIRMVHTLKDERPFLCTFSGCGRKYKSIGNLNLHIGAAHEKRTCYQCPECPKRFYFRGVLKDHVARIHKREKRFSCSACSYAAVTRREVKSHEGNVHGEYTNVKCNICGRRYKNKLSLSTHKKLKHGRIAEENNSRDWVCTHEGCTKKYKAPWELKKHVRSQHNREKPFKCPFCEFTTSQSGHRNGHILTHTGEKPYPCDKCTQSFRRKTHLRDHTATVHSELRPFSCEQCDSRFKRKATLNTHMLVHVSTTPAKYKCKVCSRQKSTARGSSSEVFFTSKYAFMKHRKTHTEQLSVKCSHRGQKATSISPLSNHLCKTPLDSVPTSEPRKPEQTLPLKRIKYIMSGNGHRRKPQAATKGSEHKLLTEKDCKPCFVKLFPL